MNEEQRPLLIELCHIAVTRNEINSRRHRARYRKNYYAHALSVVEAHNLSNSELRSLDPVRHQKRIDQIHRQMLKLRVNHPRPIKWQTMGRHKLRSMILKATGEYALAKHETMEFSIRTRERVRELTKALQCNVEYENGSVTCIHFNADSIKMIADYIDINAIQHYAEQYELDQAVHSMIKGED